MTDTIELLRPIGKYTGPAYVLGLDPGKKTGWALYHVPTQNFTCGEGPWLEVSARTEKIAEQVNLDLAIAVEKFVITVNTGKDTQAPWSLKNMGSTEYIARKHQVAEYIELAMSSSKTLWTNDKLKTIGLYRPGLGHANDATRIMCLYLATKGWWPAGLRIDDEDEDED